MTADAWLTGRRGQALAVLIALLGLAVIWFGAIDPAWSWFDDRAALLEQRQEMLAHMRDLAEGLPALRTASEDKRGSAPDAATLMLPGDSDAVAAADLQERIQKMASDAGATLTAVETLSPTVVAGNWHKVALRVSLNAPWPVLVAMMRAMESSSRRVLIDDVHFHSPIGVVRPVVMPIQASMMLYGFRPAGRGT